METRVALIGIIVEEPDSVGELNAILHDYGQYIIGRMGIPYRQRGISISALPWMRRRTSSARCRARLESWPASAQRRPIPTW